jgi:glutamate dehydrogenase (NADP+)
VPCDLAFPTKCVKWGDCGDGYVDYVRGANLGGFVKVADALLTHGIMTHGIM